MSMIEIMSVRTIPYKKAKTEILEFIKCHKDVFVSDILEELKLDVDVVIRALKELSKGKWTTSGDIQGATWEELRIISVAKKLMKKVSE